MAFTLISTTNCPKGTKTVIQSGSTGGFSFQVKAPAVPSGEVRQWGWVYNFWDTGDPSIGRVIVSQTRLNQQAHTVTTQAVPEGTQGLIVYVTEKAPDDVYSVALYRRL